VQTAASSIPPGRDLVTALARGLRAELIETHISWVLLAGSDAYKVKKPVRLPFVDYGTLEARRHFCEEELRLNRSLASSIYLGVTRITGSPEAPVLDGPGPVLEYAVHIPLRAGALFSEHLEAGTLKIDDVDAPAALLADFHGGSAPAVPKGGGFVARIAASPLRWRRSTASPPDPGGARALRAWLEAATSLAPLWTKRLTAAMCASAMATRTWTTW
jgi:hypothetical protein